MGSAAKCCFLICFCRYHKELTKTEVKSLKSARMLSCISRPMWKALSQPVASSCQSLKICQSLNICQSLKICQFFLYLPVFEDLSVFEEVGRRRVIEDRKLWKGWWKKGCRLLTKCCLFSFALQCKLKILKSFAVFSFHFHETSLLSSFAQLSLQSPAVETTHHLGAGLLVKSNGVEGVTSNGAGDSNKPRILTTHQVHVNYSQRNSPVRFSQGARKRRSVLVWIWNTEKNVILLQRQSRSNACMHVY